jgi:uncharacterized protein HemX
MKIQNDTINKNNELINQQKKILSEIETKRVSQAQKIKEQETILSNFDHRVQGKDKDLLALIKKTETIKLEMNEKKQAARVIESSHSKFTTAD